MTRDTEGGVAVYDVLKACRVADLGTVDYEQTVEERQQTVYVPRWDTGHVMVTRDGYVDTCAAGSRWTSRLGC